MKIPDRVRISGIEYEIQTVEVLRDSTQLLCGQISYRDRTIRLSESDCANHEFRCIVLWHEIIHGLLEDRAVSLDEETEEKICEAISRGIYQVLQDNGGRFFDLRDSGDPQYSVNKEAIARAVKPFTRKEGECAHDDNGHSKR